MNKLQKRELMNRKPTPVDLYKRLFIDLVSMWVLNREFAQTVWDRHLKDMKSALPDVQLTLTFDGIKETMTVKSINRNVSIEMVFSNEGVFAIGNLTITINSLEKESEERVYTMPVISIVTVSEVFADHTVLTNIDTKFDDVGYDVDLALGKGDYCSSTPCTIVPFLGSGRTITTTKIKVVKTETGIEVVKDE